MAPISRHFLPVLHPEPPARLTTGLINGSRLPDMAHFFSCASLTGSSSPLPASEDVPASASAPLEATASALAGADATAAFFGCLAFSFCAPAGLGSFFALIDLTPSFGATLALAGFLALKGSDLGAAEALTVLAVAALALTGTTAADELFEGLGAVELALTEIAVGFAEEVVAFAVPVLAFAGA